MVSVVLVEDNVPLRKSMADFLTISGYQVSEADSAMELYRLLDGRRYDVAVVDINLPHHDGFSITRYLSDKKLCSVIITSVRDAVEDRVHGYQCGADIYMVKPTQPEELAAAIGRLGAKRAAEGVAAAGQPGDAAWTYDAEAQRLWSPNGRPVALSRREARLVDILVQAGRDILRRDQILAAFGEEDTGDTRGRIDTMVSRLRAKVRQRTGMELPLVTAHNTGLNLSAPIRPQ